MTGAVALASKPKMLLVDEVVSGLSADEIRRVMDLITKIRQSGVSLLLVEHNMRVIMGLCDRAVDLYEGKAVGEIDRKDFSEEKLLAYGHGHRS